jgi:hypothetical protein
MSTVEKQINHARRRLTSNVFVQWLSVGVLAAGGLWALAIIIVRLFALSVPLGHGAWVAAIAAGAFATAWTAAVRPSPLRAAVALDAAAGLKERLSTALLVQQSTDPFARAAVADAEKAASRLHVPAHIRYRPPTVWPWSAAAVLAALILLWFMPTVNLLARGRDKEDLVPRSAVQAEQQAIKAELDDRLNKIKELARDNPDLKNVTEDIQPLEMPDTPGVTPEDIRREAVKRIDSVSEKLERELEATGENPLAELKRRMSQLEQQGGDKATAKLSEALAGGDFEGAKQALQKLADDLKEQAKNASDPEAQQKLAEMQEQLQKLADQISKLSDTVQLQKELENKAGLSEEEARKLLDQLGKMDPKQLAKELQKQLGGKGLSQEQIRQIAKKIQQNQQCKKICQKLARSMAKAAQGCQQCNSPSMASAGASNAANALSDVASQLSDLEMSEQLTNELQAQLSDLDQLRDDVCQGNCHGNCPGSGRGDRRIGPQGPRAGYGIGSRIGQQKTPYQTDPTKAKTRFQGGTVIGQMLIDGPQIRGEASAATLTTAAAQVRDALDAIEREEVPRQYRKVLQEYFERLAGLVKEKQQAAEDKQESTGEK